MVWGCIEKGYQGPIVILDYSGGKGGGFSAQKYQDQVLDPKLHKAWHSLKKKQPNLQFQQDGAPAHRAIHTKDWFKNHNIPLFPHPPQSPDLSPIEPLWNLLKTHIHALPQQPTNGTALKKAVEMVWKEISTDDVDTYVNCMPKIIQAVLNAHGGHTEY